MKRLLLFLLLALSTSAQAHTLGVDKATLTENKDGSYHLVSQVPPRFQPLITTPELPGGCVLEGSPRGARGASASPAARPADDPALLILLQQRFQRRGGCPVAGPFDARHRCRHRRARQDRPSSRAQAAETRLMALARPLRHPWRYV